MFRIDVGKFSKVRVGNLSLDIDDYTLALPDVLLENVYRMLDVDEHVKLDCNIKTVISLKAGDVTFTIGPELYVNTFSKDDNGRCYPWIGESWDTIRLPVGVFKSKCIFMNYATGKVGFATSKIAV
jgi:hypothetical protein